MSDTSDPRSFSAKKLRVALPDGRIVGTPAPRVLDLAIDLDAAADPVDCFTAEHQLVTTVCFSHTCVDNFSDPVYKLMVSAETLPMLREALEAQLAEVSAAEQALARHRAEE